MKKRINVSWRFLKHIAILASVAIVCYVVSQIIYKQFKAIAIETDDFTPLAMLIHMSIFYLIGHYDRVIEFDANRLYIRLGNSEKIIDLQEITSVKMTNWNLNGSIIWKMKYGKNAKSILFIPNPYNAHFEQFLSFVSTKNPQLNADEFRFKPLFNRLFMNISQTKK